MFWFVVVVVAAFFVFSDSGHPNVCEVCLLVVLMCVSLMISDAERLFMHLLAICTSSLKK